MHRIKIFNKAADSSINRIANRYGSDRSSFMKFKSRCGVNMRVDSGNLCKLHVRVFRNQDNFISKYSVNKAIKFLKSAGNYRGIRLRNGYPIRGQRTHTNGKTSKKLGGKKG